MATSQLDTPATGERNPGDPKPRSGAVPSAVERDRLFAVAAMGLIASDAGLGMIDTDQEKLLPLIGKPLGLPESQKGCPLDLTSASHNKYLSDDAASSILRTARGALPAQLQLQLGATLFAIFLSSPDSNADFTSLLPELRDHHFRSPVFFIAFPIKNIENFMLKPEEAGVLAMPFIESFHELARPIGITSMLLAKLCRDGDLATALQEVNTRAWHDLRFIEVMVSERLYPMIKYLGLIEKYGQLGIGGYASPGYRLGASVKDTIERFLESLKIARTTSLFNDFGIPEGAFKMEREICGFAIPDSDPLVEIPRPLLDVIATELIMNALKYLPRSPEAWRMLPMDSPIKVGIEHVTDKAFSLHFNNLYQPKRPIGSLREFKHTVMSRPLGGLAGVKRLVRSVGWNVDFDLHRVPHNSSSPIYDFHLEIRGYQVQGEGS